MRHVSQPPNSNLCGQACVAMIAGISLEESIKVFGKRGATTTKEVAAALQKLGLDCADKVVRFRKGENPAETGTVIKIVVLHYNDLPDHCTHWVVMCGHLYLDPAEGVSDGYKDSVRITSYLPIY